MHVLASDTEENVASADTTLGALSSTTMGSFIELCDAYAAVISGNAQRYAQWTGREFCRVGLGGHDVRGRLRR